MLTAYQPQTKSAYINKDQSLTFSILIQTAYEQEKPLSIVYQRKEQPHHFCGYLDQIDPAERWIRLRNGCLYETISFLDVISIELC